MADKKRFKEIFQEMQTIKEKLKSLIEEARRCCDHPHFSIYEDTDIWSKIYTVVYTCLKCGKKYEFDKKQKSFDIKVGCDRLPSDLSTRWFGWPFEYDMEC